MVAPLLALTIVPASVAMAGDADVIEVGGQMVQSGECEITLAKLTVDPSTTTVTFRAIKTENCKAL